MNAPTFFFAALFFMAFMLIVFLIIRALVLWYFKIDVLVNLMKEQNAYLKKLSEQQ